MLQPHPHGGRGRSNCPTKGSLEGKTWVAGKAEPISPRVAASLGEPMLRGNIGWARRGVPFWEINRSDGTMAPSWRDPDLLPRVAIALTVGQSAA